MRAHRTRTAALFTLLVAAGLGGCQASEVSGTAGAKRPAPPAALAPRACTTGPVTGATGKIAFSSNRTGNYEIFLMNADGTGVTKLTHDPANDDHPAWSADGTKMAFTRTDFDRRDVYVMNADGSGLTQLTTDPADDHEMAWSPDGTKIAFASKRTGNYRHLRHER